MHVKSAVPWRLLAPHKISTMKPTTGMQKIIVTAVPLFYKCTYMLKVMKAHVYIENYYLYNGPD